MLFYDFIKFMKTEKTKKQIDLQIIKNDHKLQTLCR